LIAFMERGTLNYEYVFLEGDSYEVGRQRGEYLKKYPSDMQYYTKPFYCDKATLTKNKIKEIRALYDEFCPGLNEEIEGFSDALHVSSDGVIFHTNLYAVKGGCCHMVALPKVTENHHVLVGRSYEYSLDDDTRFTCCKINGKPAHIGFSVYLFGRYEGINEHGLSITISAATPGTDTELSGLRFWTAIRCMIENCRTTDEAVYLLKHMPLSANTNFIIADKQGNAVLAESSGLGNIRSLFTRQVVDYVVSTNHYNLPEMESFNVNRMNQSVMRFQAANQSIKEHIPNVNESVIRDILQKKMPEGVCCHYYKDGLGTLYSIVADLTTMQIKVCFGSANINKWYSINIHDERKGSWNIGVPYINEYPTNSEDFYRKV